MESVPSVVTNSPSSYPIDAFSNLSKGHENIHGVLITEYTAPTLAQSTVLMAHETWKGMFWWVQDVILESAIPAPNKFDNGPECMSSSLRPNLSRAVHAKHIPTVQSEHV